MRFNHSMMLIASTALTTIALAPAVAQDGIDRGGLEDIVVTAQKREESLQQVPVAVTALNTQMIANARVTNLVSMNGLAPNLQIVNQGVASVPLVMMRGIASGTSNNAVDPKIGMYINGVYVGRSVGSVFDLADIERVEVLRGPQGTLFGRNATGGAISIVTAPPTGEFGVRQMLSYGNLDSFRSRTVIDLPALGPLSLKVSYLHDESKGQTKNLIAGKTIDFSQRDPNFPTLRYANRLGSKNVDAVQVAARLQPIDDLTIDYNFDYTDSKNTGAAAQLLGPTGDVTGQLAGAILAFQPYTGGITNLGKKRMKAVAASTSIEPLVVEGHSLTINWQSSDTVAFRSITAIRKMHQKPNIHDLGATGGLRFTGDQLGALLTGNTAIIPLLPVGPNDSFQTLMTARTAKQRQFSQELQFTVDTDQLTLVGGAFYFHERSSATDVLGIFQPIENGVVAAGPYDAIFGSGVTENIAYNDSMAIFGQATYHVSDQFDLTGGLRYTIDDRKTDLVRVSAAQGGILNPGSYYSSYNKLNYTAIASYKPTPDINTYAKISTGYVAGGILSATPYNPETLTAYELGLKSQLFNNRLRANIAAFYSDYKDLQTQTFIGGVQRFQNAAKARIYGFEGEFDFVPVDGLTLNTAIGYTNFKYKKYIRDGVDVSDIVRAINIPKWTARIGGQYDFPEFANGSNFFIRADGRYRSKMELTAFPTGNPAVEPLVQSPSVWVLDGRVGIAALPLGGVNVNLSGYVSNLLNVDRYSFAPTVVNQVALPDHSRRYGVELSLAF